MISMRFRDVLPPYVADEFQSLIDQLKAWALVEHDEEGQHVVVERDVAFVNVGSVMGWFTATPPDGWVFLRGQALNRVTYKSLFELWGTTFGAGDGSTTFNIPNAQQRFFLSKAASGTGATLGSTGGSINHTHTGPSHTHTISGSTGSVAAHNHDLDDDNAGTEAPVPADYVTVDNNLDGSTTSVAIDTHIHGLTGETEDANAHSHSAGTLAAAAGGTGATGTANPPYIVGELMVFTGVST